MSDIPWAGVSSCGLLLGEVVAPGGLLVVAGAGLEDVYFGVELSITGIQAMRSSLAGSLPVEVPDLRRPEVRRAHAADDWFPDLPDL
jgi:hypothetical protein